MNIIQGLVFLQLFIGTSLGAEVTISDGKIIGEVLTSVKGRQYDAYVGIPFAQPPIGDLRFEPPVPNEPWSSRSNLVTSTNSSKQCAQAIAVTMEILGEEDCLYLNVYAPHRSAKAPLLPVMVWVHGGSFQWGSGTVSVYGPQRLMDRDIVLVTFNYRLGFLGFLADPKDGIPGNVALLDQILALKWVQKNIEAFGGDKSRVTLFGQSSGGVSVSHLVSSPLTKGLFHAAIIESGSSLCNWAIDTNPGAYTKFLAVKSRCVTSPTEAMLKCLKSKPWKDIVSKGIEFHSFPGLPLIPRPVVDGYVIPDYPINLLRQGITNKIPILIGNMQNEGVSLYARIKEFYPRTGSIALQNDLGEMLSSMTYNPNLSQETLAKIKELYFKNVGINDKAAFRKAIISVFDDAGFGCIHQTPQYFVNSTNSQTFVYTFTYRGKYTKAVTPPGEDFSNHRAIAGPTHIDELQYLFKSSFFPDSNWNESDYKMSDTFISLWTNFATFHDPTPNGTQVVNKLPFTWEPYQTGSPKCLNFNLNPTMLDNCDSEKSYFWTELFAKINAPV